MKNDDLRAIVLLPILVIAAVTAYQGFSPPRPSEPFSELAILGPEMKASGYPRDLQVNENFTLHLYVRNHEGHVAYYLILVKVGNRSHFINETIPMEAPVIDRYERVLLDNETWVYPIILRLNEPGRDLRLIFEMWIYNETLHRFAYYGRWNQLWLNVTGPVYEAATPISSRDTLSYHGEGII